MKKMWIVTLAVPTVVNAVLRQPIEGALTVSEDEAQRLHDNKLLVGDPEPVPGADEADEGDEGDEVDEDDSLNVEPDDLKSLTVPELKAKALKDGVPLNDATRRADIIDAFVKHRTPAA